MTLPPAADGTPPYHKDGNNHVNDIKLSIFLIHIQHGQKYGMILLSHKKEHMSRHEIVIYRMCRQ